LENVRLNAMNSIAVKKIDVTKWKPQRTWDVVTANLFSEVLIAAAPSLSRAVRTGGRLIFSGILRSQENECVRAFRKNGFRIDAISRRGKWVTGKGRRMNAE
jgi:ribosomal protein L11 methyltransferase